MFLHILYMTHHAVTRVKCVTRVITRDFLRFQKTDFHFLFIFQYQVTRITLTYLQAQSAETMRRCLFKTIIRTQKWPAKVLFILLNRHK